jgi:hypothetical protein
VGLGPGELMQPSPLAKTTALAGPASGKHPGLSAPCRRRPPAIKRLEPEPPPIARLRLRAVVPAVAAAKGGLPLATHRRPSLSSVGGPGPAGAATLPVYRSYGDATRLATLRPGP